MRCGARHVAVGAEPCTQRPRRPGARAGRHGLQRCQAHRYEVAGERVVGHERQVEQVLVRAHERVVAEAAGGHAGARRSSLAGPTRARAPTGPSVRERRARGAGQGELPLASGAARIRHDKDAAAVDRMPIVPTGMR